MLLPMLKYISNWCVTRIMHELIENFLMSQIHRSLLKDNGPKVVKICQEHTRIWLPRPDDLITIYSIRFMKIDTV